MAYLVLVAVIGIAVIGILIEIRKKRAAHERDRATLNKAINSLERSYDHTLELLGDVIDGKEANSPGHTKRVTAFTIAIARHLGITADEIRMIARGAFLHDIGLTSVPDDILRKSGTLNHQELAILQEHCFRGHQLLKRLPYLEQAAEIVHSHHERFDGSGYPRGLKGHDIPLGARIFAVADTLEAIITDHPYRPGQSISKAREEIQQWSGRLFDPEIVQAFLSMPENIWKDLRDEIGRGK
jgi:HD-GYP domain-containing protein (c-di-GMP phosphodiesterase class II)